MPRPARSCSWWETAGEPRTRRCDRVDGSARCSRRAVAYRHPEPLSRTNAFSLGGGKALVNVYYRTAERLGVASSSGPSRLVVLVSGRRRLLLEPLPLLV